METFKKILVKITAPDPRVWAIGSLIFLNGLLIILETITERFANRLIFFSQITPFSFHYTTRLISVVIGFSLIYLSLNLFRAKQVAWIVTFALLLIDIILHANTRHLSPQVFTSLVLLIALLASQKHFIVKSEPENMSRAITFVTSSIAFAIFYGTLGFWLLDKKDFRIDFTLTDSFIRTLREFVLIGNTDLTPHTRNAQWFLDSLDLLGISAAAFSVYSFFRPIAYRFRTLPHDKIHMQSLLDYYGKSDLDYFKLTNDKSYFFSTSQKGAVAYKTIRGIALCLGDPVGAPEEIENTTREFIGYCQKNGWKATFLSTGPENLPMYKKLGLWRIKIGEEAVIDLETFSNHTFKKEDFGRQSRKFEKLGYTTGYFTPPHSHQTFFLLQGVSNQWLEISNHKEFSFAMGKFEKSYLDKTPIFAVLDNEENIVAFVNLIPTYQKGLATIDLMRYKKEVPNGTMDFLFTKLFFLLKDQGYKKFNLGLVPLTGLKKQNKVSGEEKLISFIVKYLNRFYSFSGLKRYKEKFDPSWENRYLVYQGPATNLIPISLAVTKALEG